MTQARKGKSGSRGLEVDFTGVQEGGKVVPEGEYLAEVKAVEKRMSQNNNAYLVFEYKILTPGGANGMAVYDNCSLVPAALWRLKQVLVALGFEVPDGKLNLELRALKGLQCGLVIEHEEYTDKKQKSRVRSSVSEIFSTADFEEAIDEEDEDLEAPAAEDEVDDSEDDDEEVEDADEDDEEEEDDGEEPEETVEEEDEGDAPPAAAKAAVLNNRRK